MRALLPLLRRTVLATLLLVPTAGCGPRQALSGGLAQMKLHVGGRTTTVPTPVAGFRLGVPASESSATSGLVVVELQPMPVANPVLAERMRALYVQPSLAARSGPVVLAGGAGPTATFWTGPEAAASVDWGIAAGASVTLELARHPRTAWGVELFARAGAVQEVGWSLVGAQVVHYLK